MFSPPQHVTRHTLYHKTFGLQKLCVCVSVSVAVHYDVLGVWVSVFVSDAQDVLQQRQRRVLHVVAALSQNGQPIVQIQRAQHITHLNAHVIVGPL